MRQFIMIAGLLSGSLSASSAMAMYCGDVNIVNMLAGPRHGSMMQVSNSSCGQSGWVCLDPEAQHMTSEKSKRLYAFLLSQYMVNRPVRLSVFDGVYASACGSNFPVVEDVRSP